MTRGARLLLVVGLSACGARSSLLDDDGGAGGQTTSLVAPVGVTASAVTTAGAGGDGGAYVSCTELTIRSPAVIFEPVGGMPVHDVALTSTDAGVVATARFTSGSQAAPDRLGHAPWDAWGAWPPAPLTPLDTAVAASPTAPIFGAEPGGLATSFVDFPSCIQRVGLGLDPSSSYPGPESYPSSQVVGQGCGRLPRAIAGLPGGPYVTASVAPLPGGSSGYFTETALIGADGSVVTYDLPACAAMPLYADVAVLNDQFVIATSQSSLPSGGYGCINPAGAPSSVGVGWLGSGEFYLLLWADLDDIVGTALVPRPDGLWLLWRESGASALTTPPVWAARLDENLNPETFFPVTSEGLTRFSAAPHRQGGFIIVSDESLGSGTIDLRRWDEVGRPTAHHQIPTGAATPSSERLSVVASPDGTSALVGWTGVDGRGYAARVDCMPDPPVP